MKVQIRLEEYLNWEEINKKPKKFHEAQEKFIERVNQECFPKLGFRSEMDLFENLEPFHKAYEECREKEEEKVRWKYFQKYFRHQFPATIQCVKHYLKGDKDEVYIGVGNCIHYGKMKSEEIC